jgi:prepilin-type N-terminal cleavage/methylation domain-containing protein
MPCEVECRVRDKSHGFSLVELALAVAVLAALLYFLLDRVLYMQEMGEKTEVEETIRSINYALRLEAASRLARGPEPHRPPLEKENPIKWLQTPPPNRAEHLKVEGLKQKELRFVVGSGGDLPHPRLISHFSYAWL